jgi:UDP-N-acetylglucosamine:LPS N-acetylglucosamine transferase
MKVGLICSAGGHLTQMLLLLEAFQGHDLFLVTYEGKRAQGLNEVNSIYRLQNFGRNPLRLLGSFPQVVRILRRERPQLIVSTGSEIAIPFFYLARPLRIRTIFVESWSRVYSPSSTGKVVYPVADVFLVQWRQLLDHYGTKARFEGGVL